jgi:hypothetical protein
MPDTMSDLLHHRAKAAKDQPSLAAYEALVNDCLAHIDALTAAVEGLPIIDWDPAVIGRESVLAILRGEQDAEAARRRLEAGR